MRKVFTLFKKEFQAYFFSPMAYVVLAMFLVISGYFFSMILGATREASLRLIVSNMGIVLLFISPLITMRLLADEKKSGTLETLMTDPVREVDVVVGKFLAAFCFFVFLLLPTGLYVVILEAVGEPDMGPVISGYVGLFLMGGVFMSVGVFSSSLSKNQIVSGVVSLVALLLLWVIGWAGERSGGVAGKIFAYIGFFEHFQDFQKGVIDTKDVFYYLTTTIMFLFMTVRILETRKWK